MAFSGDLVDFPLAELLFFFGSSSRSGWLTIQSNVAVVTFTLVRGKLVAAHSDDVQKRLGQRLVADGIINSNQLKNALRSQAQSRSRTALGSALVVLGYADASAVQRILREQAVDLIFQILIHPPCRFYYERGLPELNGIEADIALERSVLEAVRRADEWVAQQLWTSPMRLNPEVTPDMFLGVVANDWPTVDAMMNGAVTLDEVASTTGWSSQATHESLRRLQALDVIYITVHSHISSNDNEPSLPMASKDPPTIAAPAGSSHPQGLPSV
jgi:hypothetical protein